METIGRQFTHKGEPMSNFTSQLSKAEAAAQGERFLVLRNKTRLRILDILKTYGGLLCVAEIAEVLEEPSSVIPSHLAILRAVGLVSREPFGSFAYYSLKEGALDQYQQFLEQLTSSQDTR